MFNQVRPARVLLGNTPHMLCIGGFQEDSKGVSPLVARSGVNTPIAESNEKYKIYFCGRFDPV